MNSEQMTLQEQVEQRIPQVIDAIMRIPNVGEYLEAMYGTAEIRCKDREGVTILACLASIWEEVEGNKDEVRKTNGMATEIENARKVWKYFQRDRDGIIYKNNAGEMNKAPKAVVDVIVRDLRFDGVIEDRGYEVAYIRQGEVLALLAKGLVDALREGEVLGVPSE